MIFKFFFTEVGFLLAYPRVNYPEKRFIIYHIEIFRSFLNKSQPYSLALELYNFPLNIFRKKLWYHQEFVLN